MAMEMGTVYNPKELEHWYEHWLSQGYFQAGIRKDAPPYTIVIPPPNVTGKLHIGHALDFTLQDILIRFKRMQGFDPLWLPGTDHAGIATQTVVENKLRTEEGLSRYDLGREVFLERVWAWKEENISLIHEQWAKMGLSLDYSRERFTLDEGLSKAVRKVFVHLFQEGLIYRGKRMINWDPEARTALSDIEVEYKEVKGHLYHLRYPLADKSGWITVATTRPETMLGDTAVAVHPADNRYRHLIGKEISLPIVNRLIPIIGDEYVDQSFGSGAVKITPAHDPNDFTIGERHGLQQISVIDETGKMNASAGGQYEGMDRFACRKAIIPHLQELGICTHIEDYVHQVGHSERTGAVVEPCLSLQWFVKMKPLAERAIAIQRTDKKIKFVPSRFENTYLNWIENIKDWCISRQLWWGHRIPAWHNKKTGEIFVGMQAPIANSDWEQDPDVLDTWFSSALWPFSTLGWPEQTEDLNRYFPNNVLVTGYDIIYFWVARMIFTTLQFSDQVPFQEVYLHGLVRDAEGRKMSKSLANGIDPIQIIDKYGADPLRFMISTGSTQGQDLRFRVEKMEQARNFANKIWNASRFAIMNLQGFSLAQSDLIIAKSTADRWILHRLNETILQVTSLMEKYDFGETGRVLYHFIWDDLCDWYIEFAKLTLYGDDLGAKISTQSVIVYVFDQTMRLIHPFMPFLSEEIWQHLPHEGGETIMLAAWPKPKELFWDKEAEKEMTILMDSIRAARNVRAEVNVTPSKKIELFLRPKTKVEEAIFKKNERYIARFCNTSSYQIDCQLVSPEKALTAVITAGELYFPLAGLLNIPQEINRLNKELTRLNAEVARVEKKLANDNYVAKAPEHVINAEKVKGDTYRDKRDKILARIIELKS